jgi:hypothetical protein
MRNRILVGVASLIVTLATVSCGPSEEPQSVMTPTTAAGPAPNVHVTSLELGRSVNDDKTMHDATVIFKPGDTVYASIILDGEASTLAVQGRFMRDDGHVVAASTQKLAVPGRLVTEFHVSQPDGWSVGHYSFEVLFDGNSAGTKAFEIEP